MIASGRNPRSKWFTNLRLIALTILCLTLTMGFLGITSGQQGRREIVSDDFTKPRPTPTPKRPKFSDRVGRIIAARPTPSPLNPPKRYRFAASSSPNAPPLTDSEQLGVTLWRLRPAKIRESGEQLLIRENNQSLGWIPKRIEMDTPLSTAGERVRLSIESPREGYLYVVNRDLYADGRMGVAMLLFPTRTVRGVDNQVGPGKLFDLPGQEDSPNYFTVRSSRSGSGSDQVGEIFTIIITTTPLDLIIAEQPQLVSAADLAKWEEAWDSDSERFEMVGGAGTAWTKEEKEASAPMQSQQLTRDGPPPQTIYRIAAKNKAAFLINVRLSYARAGPAN